MSRASRGGPTAPPGDRVATPVGVASVPSRGGAAARSSASPSSTALAGACLWAAGLSVVGAVVGAGALVVLARGAPAWYPSAVLAVALTGYATTLGGLAGVRIAWLRWRLFGVATAAVAAAALLTVAAF